MSKKEDHKVQIMSLVILIITLMIMGFSVFVAPLSDWIVRTTGIVMLISIVACIYSTVKVKQTKKK